MERRAETDAGAIWFGLGLLLLGHLLFTVIDLLLFQPDAWYVPLFVLPRWQAVYVVPLAFLALRRGRFGIVKGVAIGAVCTFLLVKLFGLGLLGLFVGGLSILGG